MFKFSTNLLLSKYSKFYIITFTYFSNLPQLAESIKVIFQVKFSTQSNFSTEM